MKRKLIVVSCLFLLIALLVACSSNGGNNADNVNNDNNLNNNGDEGSQEEKILSVAIPTQPPTLDPVFTTADPTRDVAMQIFEPLVTINENLQPTPMLAESFEISDDGTEIEFKLREGILFHNGEEMTADDVIASMERWQEYSARAKSAFSEAEFVKEDDYQVIMKLGTPNITALSVLSATTQFPAIMPKEVVESAGSDGITDYIGTGPFEFDEWRQDEYIRLKKFADYQHADGEADGLAGKKEAMVDVLELKIVTDSSTRVSGVLSGEYDLSIDVPYDNFDLINSDADTEIYTDPAGYNVLIFNKKEGALADKLMRQAVTTALDMEDILVASHINEQFYSLNGSLFLEEQTDWYSTAGSDIYNSKDQDLAKQLMEEADYDGEPITLITSREFEDFYNASVVIKEQLDSLGIPVNLEVYDWSTVVEKRKDPSAYDGFITEWSIINDPTQIIFLHSENDWDGWTDSPEIDQYIEEIRAAASQEEATEINEKLQEEIFDYMPALKFGDKNFLHAHNKNVSGFQYLNAMSFWNTSKDD